MLLRPGKTCEEAVKFLDDLNSGSLTSLENEIPHPTVGGPEWDNVRIAVIRKYDKWVDQTALELRAFFAEPGVPARMRGERYALILGGHPLEARTMQLLHAELSSLGDFLRGLVNQCRELQERFRRHQHHAVVPDTNTLLHFARFDKIPWAQLYGVGTCVAIPHVVVDEIDRKSFAESAKIQKRARGVYRLLEQKLDQIEEQGFADLGDGVTFEVLADGLGHRRLPNNDDEAVSQAAQLQQAIAPTPVTVITRDIGMRTRAKAWQLRAEKLPDKYLIREDGLSTADLDEAVKSIELPEEGGGGARGDSVEPLN